MLPESDDEIISILNSGNVLFTRISQCDSKLPTFEQLYVRVTVRTGGQEDARDLYLKGQMLISEKQGPETPEAKLHPTSSSLLINEINPNEQTDNHSEMHRPLLQNDAISPKGESPNGTSDFGDTISSSQHVNPIPHQCSHCEASFIQKKRLALHMKIHKGERPYQCNICDKRFKRKLFYNQHLIEHNKHVRKQNKHLRLLQRQHAVKERYPCKECGKDFSRNSDLKRHMKMCGKDFSRKIHKFDILYPCSRCEKAFINESELEDHMKCDHVIEHASLELYQCKKCDKNFSQNEELMLHMFIHTGEKPFPCSLCEKGFLQNSDLKKHMERHTETYNLKRPFQCNICDKAFNNKTLLKYHLSTHLKDIPYQCTLCAKVFFENSQLEDHIRSIHNGKIIHTKEKQISCNLCKNPKYFLNDSALKKHMDTHLEPSPMETYQCSRCTKSFRDKNKYEDHMMIHIDETPYKCNLCVRSFFKKEHLEDHINVHICEPKIEINDEDIDLEKSCTESSIEVKVEEIDL